MCEVVETHQKHFSMSTQQQNCAVSIFSSICGKQFSSLTIVDLKIGFFLRLLNIEI
jgi:hypothetical protein